jgi:DNA damage-binding protein 1
VTTILYPRQKTFDDEISCLSCLPVDPSKPFTPQVVVGFWGSNRVKIFSVIDNSNPFKLICSSEPYSSVPRSVLLHNFGTSNERSQPDYRPHLMAGLADGTVVSQAYNSSEHQLRPPNISTLGGAAVHLTSYEVDGRRCVFACGKIGEVYYWNNTRLQRSPISLKVSMSL